MKVYLFKAQASGGGGTTTLILDQFTDANSTRLHAHTIAPTNVPGTSWTEDFGNWQIQGNACAETSGTTQSYAHLDAGQANVTVSLTFTVAASNNSGLLCRFQDTANQFLWTGNGTLYEQSSGTFTQRGQSSVTPANGDVLKVVCSGGSLTCTINGGNTVSYTTSDLLTATRAGVYANADTSARIDNFTVTSP